MILISGGAGKTGRAIIRSLAGRGGAVRALVRRPDQAESMLRLGAAEVAVADMRDSAGWSGALLDVQAVYLLCPNLVPDELDVCRIAIAAASDAGVHRLVYHSVLHPETRAMAHHLQKLRVEEHLLQCDLPWTVLQPAAYMQNVLTAWPSATSNGVFPVPYSLTTRLGMVDLEDVAQVAATVLTEPGHEAATYQLCGPEVLTPAGIADVIERRIGRPVRAERIPAEVWESQARTAGLRDYQVQTLLKMFRYYECYGFWGNPRILGFLLGRPPATFDEFVVNVIESRGGAPAP